MGLAIVIVSIMYFFLLPARYAGIRYAPTVIERQVVLTIIGIAVATGYTLMVGYSITAKPIDLATFLLSGAIAIYVATFPFRILLSFKIPTLEKALLCISSIAFLGYWIALLFFTRS